MNNRYGSFLCLLTFCLPLNVFPRTQVLFSPDDKPRKKLIELIEKTKHRIHAAVYMITDRNIAKALARAKRRGIDVQIVTDGTTLTSGSSKIDQLKQEGIEIFTHTSPTLFGSRGPREGVMHNKFALLDDKVWTGSFNWTWSANHKNQENVILIDEERDTLSRYAKQFALLKQRTSERRTPRTPSKKGRKSKKGLRAHLRKIRQRLKGGSRA